MILGAARSNDRQARGSWGVTESESHLHNVAIFTLNRLILLASVGVRDMVRYVS
jgi:hypothetical protein